MSNCGKPAVKLYFTLTEQNNMVVDRTHLESGYVFPYYDSFFNLTKEVKMFCSILDNPAIQFIVQAIPPAEGLCDICFKEKVDGQDNKTG